jgi:hypothetical protein
MDLLNLIHQGESGTLEFKQSFGKEAIETVCAFANAKGGYMVTVDYTLQKQSAEGHECVNEALTFIRNNLGLRAKKLPKHAAVK